MGAAGGGEFAAQFEHHAFGGFLADAGGGGEAFDVFGGDGGGKLVGAHGGEDAERGFGADAAHFDELAEGVAFAVAAEAEEEVGIFAHDELGVERDGFAHGGQGVEGLHGNVGFVGDAVYVDNDLRGDGFDEFAGELADHGMRLPEKWEEGHYIGLFKRVIIRH